METITKSFTVHAIGADVVAQLRTKDDAGRTPEPFVDSDGGSPLRCCNRLSRPGDRLVLASYSPLHRWATTTGKDPGAYDANGHIVGGRVIDEGDMQPERAIDEVFADPQVAFVHARALLAGCFTFAIERVTG